MRTLTFVLLPILIACGSVLLVPALRFLPMLAGVQHWVFAAGLGFAAVLAYACSVLR
jgi:hypothetical protein